MIKLSALNPLNNFRVLLIYLAGSIVLVMTLASTYLVGMLSIAQVKQDKGTLMQESAAQMPREMDKGIFDRRREIQILASLRLLRDPAAGDGGKTFITGIVAFRNGWISTA